MSSATAVATSSAGAEVTLQDKYTRLSGRVLLSGPQALVRLPMVQHLHDRAAGLRTGGYITGYQGSPLATYDFHLFQAAALLREHNIHFQPAVNEDLAATACWGTQQLRNFQPARVDGVFAIWYGKGPGVDRAGDAIKHGNHSGTYPHGGVLAVFGDDHAGKSSTLAHQSEQAFAANSVPVIYPSTVEEYFQFGLFGWALSRYSGLWVGFKTVNETIEQTQTVTLDLERSRIVIPAGGVFPQQGVHYRNVYTPALNDILVTRYKLPLVHLFARSNSIDRTERAPTGARRLGIVAAGKCYQDVKQALMLLGLDRRAAAQLGISIYKPGLIWPLEPQGVQQFARDHEELLFIEEKKAFLENQAAKILYAADPRPRIIGKHDEHGVELLPSDVPLTAELIASVIAARLQRIGISNPRLEQRGAECAHRAAEGETATEHTRNPFYCSGCPHTTSTRLPAGSQGMGGIGCHGMATFTRNDTFGVTHMGGEGATWIGAAQFTDIEHVFQNLGDGTYYHSGLLAIRAAVAAGVNITYKILFNDATAMTGGQPLAGPISVGGITQQVLGEGVKKVVVVTDRPELYGPTSGLAPGVEVHHRDQLDRLQRLFREIPGTTIIIYEQTCAAEKRRRRKRKAFPDPPRRMFINEAVCEGCGDCSVQSNCMSIHPVETEFGRKRVIDQSTCNKDYSCVKGFCPSFVTVLNGAVRKAQPKSLRPEILQSIPSAAPPPIDTAYGILIAGIGGTGVVTVGAVLAMASHIDGKYASVYDMTGMAQKGAAVYSHLKISNDPEMLAAQKLGNGEADLLFACDLIAATTADGQYVVGAGRSSVVGNSVLVPTADFQSKPDIVFDGSALERRLGTRVGKDHAMFISASTLARDVLGDTLGANFILVGYALQRGLLPLSAASIERAIELNGAAVEFNKQALALGRLWAHDSASLLEIWRPGAASVPNFAQSAEEIQRHRVVFLRGYQNARYAGRYTRLVDSVRAAEQRRTPGRNELTTAVARYFAKLMAYKDEYEVARLHTSKEFQDELRAQFTGDIQLRFNLAPPMLARRENGQLVKREFGAWVRHVFWVLARLRWLRGTALDPFGRTAERRRERAWIDRYEALITEVCDALNDSNHAAAVELACVPDQIRGYGHIKEQSMKSAESRAEELLARVRRSRVPLARAS